MIYPLLRRSLARNIHNRPGPASTTETIYTAQRETTSFGAPLRNPRHEPQFDESKVVRKPQHLLVSPPQYKKPFIEGERWQTLHQALQVRGPQDPQAKEVSNGRKAPIVPEMAPRHETPLTAREPKQSLEIRELDDLQNETKSVYQGIGDHRPCTKAGLKRVYKTRRNSQPAGHSGLTNRQRREVFVDGTRRNHEPPGRPAFYTQEERRAFVDGGEPVARTAASKPHKDTTQQAHDGEVSSDLDPRANDMRYKAEEAWGGKIHYRKLTKKELRIERQQREKLESRQAD
ncbi:hypothetical protein FLONG3_3211 [Fusarium longipes]|uniref:Uncharacterized protein n=1 Tax=Fusarium longipes TaxID=694270 RepID=A0A395T1R9_9HYPO|nr:hypothetical protein FLONG3_3211 [Fusarium longipes]